MNKIQIIVFAALIIVCVLLLWKVDNQSSKIETLSASLKTAKNTILKHEENIKITEGIANEHQNRINSLNSTINSLRRTKPRCVTISGSSSVHSGSGSGGGHGEENGLRSEWLYEYAGQAERYRIERNSCKEFVNRTWDSRFNQ